MRILVGCSGMSAAVFVAHDFRALRGLRAPLMASSWAVLLRTPVLRSRTVLTQSSFLLRASSSQWPLLQLEAGIRLTPFTRRTRYFISSFLKINYRFSALTTRSPSFLFDNLSLSHTWFQYLPALAISLRTPSRYLSRVDLFRLRRTAPYFYHQEIIKKSQLQ